MADADLSLNSEIPTDADPMAARLQPSEGVDSRTRLESTLSVLLELLPHLRQLRDRAGS